MTETHALRLVATIERISRDLEITKKDLAIKEEMLAQAIRDRHVSEQALRVVREQLAFQEAEDRRLKAWVAVQEAREERWRRELAVVDEITQPSTLPVRKAAGPGAAQPEPGRR